MNEKEQETIFLDEEGYKYKMINGEKHYIFDGDFFLKRIEPLKKNKKFQKEFGKLMRSLASK
jgi:hypothetical protein